MAKKVIWKYKPRLVSHFRLKMPVGAQILAFRNQRGEPCIWAMVDPEAKMESRLFRMVGTGHKEVEANFHYIGTELFDLFDNDSLAMHLFEVLPSNE